MMTIFFGQYHNINTRPTVTNTYLDGEEVNLINSLIHPIIFNNTFITRCNMLLTDDHNFFPAVP